MIASAFVAAQGSDTRRRPGLQLRLGFKVGVRQPPAAMSAHTQAIVLRSNAMKRIVFRHLPPGVA